jgi:hypothetical protein
MRPAQPQAGRTQLGNSRALIAAETEIADILARLSREMGQAVKGVEVMDYGDGRYNVEIVPRRLR